MTEESVLQSVTLHVCDEEGLTTIAHVAEAKESKVLEMEKVGKCIF